RPSRTARVFAWSRCASIPGTTARSETASGGPYRKRSRSSAELSPTQRVQERAEFAVRFVDLRGRIAVGDDPGPGVEDRAVIAKLRAAKRDRELAIAVGVDPSHRTGVGAPIERLQLGDHGKRGLGRPP